ncbi:MAG: OmpA family protein [Flectobacillus sp.]|nr:OmpA family protein [Flectobacillus sp.]
MSKYIYLLFSLAILQSCVTPYQTGSSGNGTNGSSSGGNYPSSQPSNYPNGNGRAADKGVTVSNIRLTDQYTILYVTYLNTNGVYQNQQGGNNGIETIGVKNTAQLIAANGARTFRFIKAEGIPTLGHGSNLDNIGMRTRPGDQVNFVLYFERLDRGLENFDLFECNDYDYLVCWNVYGLYVKNPAPVYQQPAPQQQPVPTQKPLPKQTPSNTGGTSTKVPKTGKVGEVETPKTPQTPSTPPVTTIVNDVAISGFVKNSKNNSAVSATINYKISSSKRDIDSVQSFASTGLYRISLQKGQVYTYIASAKGYQAVNEVLDLSKTAGGQKITKDIYLLPLNVGDKITLKNIYFEMSKSDLLPASFAELDKLVAMMKENPTMQIRLEGHTDIVGDADANLELSQDRVDACKIYLTQKGISSTRIQAMGFGDKYPIVKKGTDEERKVNRRVEFLILKL